MQIWKIVLNKALDHCLSANGILYQADFHEIYRHSCHQLILARIFFKKAIVTKIYKKNSKRIFYVAEKKGKPGMVRRRTRGLS